MTRRISSRSAKSTTSDIEPVETGQPATDPSSESISGNGSTSTEPSLPTSDSDMTTWYLEDSYGDVATVRIKGNGRVSWSRSNRGNGAGEVRIYRNETTKVYDAVFSDVVNLWSGKVEISPLGRSIKAIAHDKRKMENAEKIAAKLIGKRAKTVEKLEAWDDDDPEP